MVFAPLAPLVVLAGAIVFWMSSWVYKYQLMFVFTSKVESGGVSSDILKFCLGLELIHFFRSVSGMWWSTACLSLSSWCSYLWCSVRKLWYWYDTVLIRCYSNRFTRPWTFPVLLLGIHTPSYPFYLHIQNFHYPKIRQSVPVLYSFGRWASSSQGSLRTRRQQRRQTWETIRTSCTAYGFVHAYVARKDDAAIRRCVQG